MSLWACSLLKEALRSIDTSSGTPFLPPRHSCLQAVWTSRLIQPLLAPFSQVPRWARARVDLRAPRIASRPEPPPVSAPSCNCHFSKACPLPRWC